MPRCTNRRHHAHLRVEEVDERTLAVDGLDEDLGVVEQILADDALDLLDLLREHRSRVDDGAFELGLTALIDGFVTLMQSIPAEGDGTYVVVTP
jgi:hypothetical protein